MPRQRFGVARGVPPVVDLRCRPRVVVVDDSALIQEFVAGLLAKEFTVTAVFVDAESPIDRWHGALAARALGYTAKRDLGTDLLPALRAVLAGRRFLSSVVELS